MLTDLCQEIHNWFVVQKVFGKFAIVNGKFDEVSWEWNPFYFPTGDTSKAKVHLQKGQYFRVVGSVFNDGVYQYPATGLVDESFDGAIWTMAVPPAVIALSEAIDEWRAKYETIDSFAMSPFDSESFGGYSYSKSGGYSSGDGSGSWQSVFKNQLNKWRKLM